MEKWLTRAWYDGAGGGFWLLPLSALYGFVMFLRSWAYKIGLSVTLDVARPVIVVGNITVGGTGKTPLVIWLAKRLMARGLKVVIISRGYGRSAKTLGAVSPQSPADWREVGDEPVLIGRRTGCHVIVTADRAAAARSAVEMGADVIISDDGLQHLQLGRDFEIAVIDGARGFGNGHLLPTGPLRERTKRLSQVNLIVTNDVLNERGAGELQRLGVPPPLAMSLTPSRVLPVESLRTPERPETRMERRPRIRAQPISKSLEAFRGRRVHAVAGIGHPERFFKMLRAHGIEVIEHAFPDHHPFAPEELLFGDDLPMLMTEKDAVRALSFATASMWFVPVDAEFSVADTQRFLIEVDLMLNDSGRVTR